MLTKLRKLFGFLTQEEREDELYNRLIHHEGQIGSKLFNKSPNSVLREFFCLDEVTWIWYEEWIGRDGEVHKHEIRYEVRPDSVVKFTGGHYSYLTKTEAEHFFDAVRAYKGKVMSELYSAPQV